MAEVKEMKKLPEGWKKVRLGEILKYEQPYNYIVESTDYKDYGSIPVLTAGKTFILGYTEEEDRIYTDLPVIIFDDFTTENKFVKIPFKVKSSAMKFLKVKNENYSLKFIFESMQLLKYVSLGGDHKRRWISEFQYLQIPLPPLPEQHHIASILSTVDNAIEKTAAIIEKYKRIKQGLMQDLLTKGIDENGQIRSEETHKFKDSPPLGRMPEGWDLISLEKDVELITGLRPKGGAVEEGIPSLGGEHITLDGRVIFTDDNAKYIPESFYFKMRKGKVEKYDILINKDGANAGKVGILQEKFYSSIAINEHLFILRSKKHFDQQYLFYQLLSYPGQKYMKDRITGSAQPGLSSTFVKNLFILKPPLPEQHCIATILSQIDKTIKKEREYKEKLERMKQGLMEDLLTGKVRVNHLVGNYEEPKVEVEA